MRIFRYRDSAGVVQFGVESEERRLRAEGSFPDFIPTDEEAEVAAILAPIVPTQIIGIGQNYRLHAAESNSPVPVNPIVFYKNVSSVQDPGGPIRLPTHLKTCKPDYEAELAVVIGKTCLNVSEDEALSYVAGYTCGNDVSARDWQRDWGGTQWCKAKSFDTFCPLGPVLVTPDEIESPNKLKIKATLNGEIVQDWNTDDMIFPVTKLIEFLSSDTTLPAGTVIMTGTPHGVGMGRKPPLWLKSGDEIQVEIEKIGVLSNHVV